MKKLWNKLGGWGMIGLVVLVGIVMLNLIGCAPSPTVEQNEPVQSYTVETINLPPDIRYVDDIPSVVSFSQRTRLADSALLYITNENVIKLAVYGVAGFDLHYVPDPISYIIFSRR